jgi:hypothetical protein
MTEHHEFSVDEIVGTLQRTSLPSIVVEGRDDIVVYRRIEERMTSIGADVLPALGRDKLIKVFERRSELPSTARVVFIADKDTWVHSGVPAEYCDQMLVFTDGYSIENDLYRDGQLEGLLLGAERQAFERELEDFVSWYAIALSRHLIDENESIRLHPNHVLDSKFFSNLVSLRHGEGDPQALRDEILSDYPRLLRGKSLLDLLVRQTTRPGRQPSHKPLALLELVAVNPGPLLQEIQTKASRVLSSC